MPACVCVIIQNTHIMVFMPAKTAAKASLPTFFDGSNKNIMLPIRISYLIQRKGFAGDQCATVSALSFKNWLDPSLF